MPSEALCLNRKSKYYDHGKRRWLECVPFAQEKKKKKVKTHQTRSQVCLRSLGNTSGTAGFLLRDKTQWFICPTRSSRALIRTHRVILMLSLRQSRSTTPLEFITSQHWLPRHCIVPCGRTDGKLCVWLPRAHAAVGTTSHDLTQRWKVHFFFLPQHSCHVRRINPANAIKNLHYVVHLLQTRHRWIIPAVLRPQVNICFTRQVWFCHKGEIGTCALLLPRSAFSRDQYFVERPDNITIQSFSCTWHKSSKV